MTFPSIASTATTADTTSGSVTVNMPSGIVAGDLLLVFCGQDKKGIVTQSGGSDWTKIEEATDSKEVSLIVFAKIAEGSDSLSLTSTDSKHIAIVANRIINHGVQDVSTDITLGAANDGESASPDPPNCNPGTAKDYLWIEVFSADHYDATDPWESTNYTQGTQFYSAAQKEAATVATAYRQLNASAEDPGVMSLAASEEWVAQTLAILPPNIVAGVGSGLISVSGSGVGSSKAAAAGSGTARVTGSGVGALTAAAVGSGAVAVAGAATGTGVRAATGSGAVSAQGSAVGAATGAGVGSGLVAVTGSGVPACIAEAAGSGLVALFGEAAATGINAAVGSCSVAVAGSGVGTGVNAAIGSGFVSVAGVAVGHMIGAGVGSGLITLTGLGVYEPLIPPDPPRIKEWQKGSVLVVATTGAPCCAIWTKVAYPPAPTWRKKVEIQTLPIAA